MAVENSPQAELQTGTFCRIYSNSKKKWFHGEVVQVIADEQGEWLKVRFDKSKSKKIHRDSPNLLILRKDPNYKLYDSEEEDDDQHVDFKSSFNNKVCAIVSDNKNHAISHSDIQKQSKKKIDIESDEPTLSRHLWFI